MIGPQEFENILQDLENNIPAITAHFATLDQDHLRGRIKDVDPQDIFIAASLPSGDRRGTMDSNHYMNTFLLFILKKFDRGNRTYAKELDDMQACFNVMQAIEKHLDKEKDKGCNWLSWYDGTFSYDPEHNYQECDGYVLTFTIKRT